MEPSCVRHTLIPATSKLFADYLYDPAGLGAFFPHYFGDERAFTEAAKQIKYPESRRAALVSALREQNGDSAALRKLAQPGTVAVVTGQQVGLFSGPAYTVFKAVTAAKLAQQLSEQGIPAVPVFWLATEDHDLAEVDHVWLFNQDATPRKIALSGTTGIGGPVGEVTFADDLKAELRSALGALPFADEVVEKIAQAYRPGSALGPAFRSLLQDLLRDLGLLFIDPLERSVREIATPLLQCAVDAVPELVPALQKRNKDLEAAGYHAQVNIDKDSSLLFLINGKRAPVRWKDGRFIARDTTYTAAQLRDQGTALSPNALLRPVMQDYLLPTVAYVGGPAEIAYMAQAQVLYEKLLGRMPVIFPRSSMTLLDSRAAKILEKYGMRLPDLLDHHQQVKTRMAAQLVPTQLADKFENVGSALSAALKELQGDLSKFDPTLEAAAKKSAAKISYQVEKLGRKTANETLRRDERAASDATYVLNLIYPERHLQERFYSIVPFLAKSGLDLPKRLLDETPLSCPDHLVRLL